MSRIMAIDYGKRRMGIAVTDPLQILSSPLDTIDADKIFVFLKNYLNTEEVSKIVVGWPTDLKNRDTDSTDDVRKFCVKVENLFPKVELVKWDERFTSSLAKQAIIDGGIKKMKRRDKKLIDKISASLILQSYIGI